MNVEAINVQNSAELQMRKASDQVSEARKQKDEQVQSEPVEKAGSTGRIAAADKILDRGWTVQCSF